LPLESPTAPESPLALERLALERAKRLETEHAVLAQLVKSALEKHASSAPSSATEPRPSLSVRAATGGYRLTKQGMAVVGLLATVAEIVSRLSGFDYGPLYAIARAFFESA
jgi:hypothetical protein